LPKVEVYTAARISGATDSSDPHGSAAFTSTASERVTATSVPMIEPAHVVSLPKGQCFALIEGGQLYKVRMPLPKPEPDEKLPSDLQEMVKAMRSRANEEESWWQGGEGAEGEGMPAGLTDGEEAVA
jgi:hypothetical protein